MLIIVQFFASLLLAFYIPGRIILGKTILIKRSNFEKFVLSTAVGCIAWIYQGVLFGYLHLRWLSYLYLLLFALLYFKKFIAGFSFHAKLSRIRHGLAYTVIFLLIFSVGMFGQLQQFVVSGFIFPDGMRMYSVASDDAFWHSSLIVQLVRRFPPYEPGMSGTYVHNYHYWSNILIAEVSRVFYTPVLPTQFLYMYPLISFLLGGLSYVLGKTLKLSKIGIIVLLILQYFASDAIYLLALFTKGSLEFTVHPLEDGTMFLENPPRAVAIIATLLGIIMMHYWFTTRNKRAAFISIFVFASIIGLKVHNGIGVLAGLFILSCYFILTKQFRFLLVPFFTFVLSALIYLPVNKGSGMPVYAPFEMSRMFAVQDKLSLSMWELARRVYVEHDNTLQTWRMDIQILVIFILAQFGIRNIGWLPFPSSLKKIGIRLYIFIAGGIAGSLFIGTFFIQPVAFADTFNFYLAMSILLSIVAAANIDWIVNRMPRKMQAIIIILILSLVLPRWIYKTQSFQKYLSSTQVAVSFEEIEAMNFLRAHSGTDDIVLVFNKITWDGFFPYVSIFTDRDMFLSGQGIMGRHGIAYKEREDIVDRLSRETDSKTVTSVLQKNNIRFLYYYGAYPLSVPLTTLGYKTLLSNNAVTILEVH